nr:unnamed protein product [Spirometra erinaceieuropaei]
MEVNAAGVDWCSTHWFTRLCAMDSQVTDQADVWGECAAAVRTGIDQVLIIGVDGGAGLSENPKCQANKVLVPVTASSSNQLVLGSRIFVCIGGVGVSELSVMLMCMADATTTKVEAVEEGEEEEEEEEEEDGSGGRDLNLLGLASRPSILHLAQPPLHKTTTALESCFVVVGVVSDVGFMQSVLLGEEVVDGGVVVIKSVLVLASCVIEDSQGRRLDCVPQVTPSVFHGDVLAVGGSSGGDWKAG